MGYSPWGHKDLDTSEQLYIHTHRVCGRNREQSCRLGGQVVGDEAVKLGRAQTPLDLVIHAKEAAGNHGVRWAFLWELDGRDAGWGRKVTASSE